MSGFGWDLPPGVHGNEDAFGPQQELSKIMAVECPSCGWSGEVAGTLLIWSTGAEESADCPECGIDITREVADDDYYDDPDWGPKED